jgi:putative aminopeptidase FrvX
MFVRAVWRNKRPVEIKQNRRDIGASSTREADALGLSGSDFGKMTLSLFDR